MKRGLILLAVLICALASAAAARAAGVVYTAQTVVIPASVAKANLIGVTSAGVFEFKSAAGALAQLKPGKVMLLSGTNAQVVTAVSHPQGKLYVTGKDASLTQLVKSGTITFSDTPDFTKGFSAPIPVNDSEDGSVRLGAAPAVRVPYAPRSANAEAGPLTVQGGYKSWGYSISVTPQSDDKFKVSGTICMGYRGSDDCANGPAQAVAVAIEFDGTIDLRKVYGSIQVANSKITKLVSGFKALTMDLHTQYAFSRGDGSTNIALPKIHLPVGWDFPIPVYGVPFFVRLQFAALLQVLSKPAKNTTAYGEGTSSISGSPAVDESGSGSGAQSASATVDAGTHGTGVSLAALGTDVTLQAKLGVALGTSAANAMVFTDLTDTIGQEHQSAIAGGFCSSYVHVLDWGVGVGYELGLPVLGVTGTKRTSLKTKTVYYTEPGCKQISG